MSTDLTKYDKIRFHPDDKMNEKIKAYMIIFDYQTSIGETDDNGKIEHFNRWEEVFLKEEFYEIIPSIIHRRGKLITKIKYDKLSVVHRMAHNLSDILKNIINCKEK